MKVASTLLLRLMVAGCVAVAFNAWSSDAAMAERTLYITHEASTGGAGPNFKYDWYKVYLVGGSKIIWSTYLNNENNRWKGSEIGLWKDPFYVVATPPEGWELGGGKCDGQDINKETNTSKRFTIPAFTSRSCWFSWFRIPGSVSFTNEIVDGPAGQTFTYALTDADGNPVELDKDVLSNGAVAKAAVPPGDATLTITPVNSSKDDWTLEVTDGSECSLNEDGTVTVRVTTHETTTSCTFTNTRDTGSVSFKNVVVGGPTGQKFTYALTDADSNPVELDNDVLGNGAVAKAYTVATGDANLTITPVNGSKDDWTLEVADGSCTVDSEGGFTVPIQEGERIQCTFTNTRDAGSVSFTNEIVDGPAGQEFTYVLTDVDGNPVALDPSELGNGDTVEADTVATGEATLTITPVNSSKDDWTLSVSGDGCVPQDDGTVTVLVAGGETQCTFTNTRNTGSVSFTNEIVDDPTGQQEFTYALTDVYGNSVELDPSELGDGGETKAEDIPTGEATLSITPTSGAKNDWTLTVAGDGCAIQNDGTVTVPVIESDTQCTVTNTRTAAGSIAVVLGLEDGSLRPNQRFGFQGDLAAFSLPNARRYKQSFTDLPSGRYTIAQVSRPNKAWSLASVSCDGGHEISDNNAVSVNLVSGEDVTCTFTARFDAVDEAMAEETRRFIYRRVDNLLSHGPDRSRLLRRLETPTQRSSQDRALKLSGSEPVDPGAANVGAADPLGSVPNSETTLLAAGGSGRSSSPYSSGVMIGSVMMSLGPEALKDDPAPSAPGALWQIPPHTDDVMGQGALGIPTTGPSSTSTALFSLLAGQMAPLGLGQGSSFKFGTSLSEMRAKAAEAEAPGYQKKLEDAGLSLSEVSGLTPLQEHRTGFDLWVEGQFSAYTDDIGGIPREGDFGVLYMGADYVLAPGVLVGALVQVDDTKEDINGSERTGEIDGTGWMAVPYFGFKLLDNLFFDTRAAWGRSDNDIWLRDGDLGFRNGSFETDRWLATATLTGVYTHDAWRLSPELGFAYGHEAYDTYTNSLDQLVPGASANIGRLTGGAELAYSIQMHNGTTLEPMVGIEGIWNFDSDDLVIDGVLHQTDESRAKIEGGLLVNTPSGWSLRTAGNYDGLGGGAFQSYGGSLWLNVPFH